MNGQANNSEEEINLNRYFLQNSLWPTILYTTVLILVGTVGNILVLVVYRRHFRRSVTRMFIYALAILDLGNCLITMPAELTIIIQFTNFPSPIWCKVTRYLTYVFNGTSSFVLIAIALDRYFKVCRPMKTLITVRRAKIICVSAFLITAVVATPALVIYGELRLPIRVSGGHVTILAQSEPSIKSSFLSSYSSTLPHNMNPQLSTTTLSHNISPQLSTTTLPHNMNPQLSTTTLPHNTNLQSRSDATLSHNDDLTSNDVVYGRLCLLNSENIDGTKPIIFYTTMFVMYILMVGFFIFFYGKVAKTMFALTSKHTKMTSFSIQRACTPSSNSFAPDDNEGPGYQNNEEPSATANKAQGSNSASKCSNKINEEGSKAYNRNTFQGQLVKDGNKESAAESTQQANTAETGYGTRETSTDSETRTDAICKLEQLLTNSTTLNTKHNGVSCDNASGHNLQQRPTCPEEQNNPTQVKDSPTTRSKSHPQESSVNDRNSKLSNKKTKTPKKSKIPKIKVQKATKTECPSTDSRPGGSERSHRSTLLPLSTNPLFSRRIKSTETIGRAPNLHAGQLSDSRHRGPRFPDIHDAYHSRDAQNLSWHRNKQSGLSTVSLDYLTGDDNTSLTYDKTCTLTKMSTNGRSKRCVLPLRGLTTKTASHVREQQTTTSGQNVLTSSNKCLNSFKATSFDAMLVGQRGLTSSDLCLSTSYKNNFSQADLRLELGDNLSKSKTAENRSSPGQLNSPDADSVVTLRHRTTDTVVSETHKGKGSKAGGCHVQINAPRKEIISAADILEEQHRRHSLHPFRTSRMLFVISLVFVVSFLPFFVIALARSSMGSSFMSRGEIELGLISVFIRSSLISNAVNPIAYGLLSTHFRRECVGIFRCMSRRK